MIMCWKLFNIVLFHSFKTGYNNLRNRNINYAIQNQRVKKETYLKFFTFGGKLVCDQHKLFSSRFIKSNRAQLIFLTTLTILNPWIPCYHHKHIIAY